MNQNKNSDEFVTITNKQIYDLLEATHAQVQKTNGRVTKLEQVSIGNWIANHPFKFSIFVVVLLSIITPDTRNAVIEILKGII